MFTDMKEMSFKRLLSVIFLSVLVCVSQLGLPTSAQQNKEREGLGISPTQLTLDADPGEQISGKFLVVNTGDVPVNYHTYVSDFTIRNEDYEKDFEPVPRADSMSDWIDVPDVDGQLEPEAQKELGYTINVPKDAVPKGYYSVIFAETIAAEADSTGVARIKRVGSLVYLTVNGGSKENGSIVSYEAKGYQRDRPIKAQVRIANKGNVHFGTTGTFKLKDVFGRTVGHAETTGIVIPDTIRKFSPELKLSQPFGIYRLEASVNFLGKDNKLPTKWIIVGSPLWLVFWVAIIIAWAIVLVRWVKRRVKQKKA